VSVPPFFEERTGVLLEAILFAALKHRDQRRKDAFASPYLNHPLQVAGLLWRLGGVRDEATLVAALLHDTVEDTATSPEEIEAKFGPVVKGLVLEVTDDKSLPGPRRKQLQVERARALSLPARLIKLADKITNLRDTIVSPPRNWSRQRVQEYVLWTERVVAGLRGTSLQLEAEYDRALSEAKAQMDIS
jgi:guanosine-3',5'-bis(diphosphate) 3'-pyrophosphohydrolase